MDSWGDGAGAVDEAAVHARLDSTLRDTFPDLRPALVAERRKRLGQMALVWTIGPAIVVGLLASGITMIAVFALPAAPAVAGFAILIARTYRAAAGRAMIPLICRAAGDVRFAETDLTGAAPERLREAGLSTRWSAAEGRAVFHGRHRGVGFTMADLSLGRFEESPGRIGQPGTRRHVSAFRGLFLDIATPAPVGQTILLTGSRRLFGLRRRAPTPAPGMIAVTPPPELGGRFAVHATDPDAVTRILTPFVAERLAGLHRTAGHRGLDAAFAGSSLLLLVPSGRIGFGLGSVWLPVGGLRRAAHRVLDRVLIPHRLIDGLLG